MQRHLQQAVNEMTERVDKSVMRPMQKNAYLCAARCFDNTNATDSMMQGCIQSCQQNIQYNQQVMQQEMQTFQVFFVGWIVSFYEFIPCCCF